MFCIYTYFSKLRVHLLVVCLMVACVLMFSGCRSSKGVTASDANKYKPAVEVGKVDDTRQSDDYSGDVSYDMGFALVAEAKKWFGAPYRFGGADRSGTDCSGLVMSVYLKVCKIKLPRTTSDQKAYCTKMARNNAQVGDLVFFGSSKKSSSTSHVGIYIGNGEMIHASSSHGVMVSEIDSGYWGKRFQGVGRVENARVAWAANHSLKLKRPKAEPTPIVTEDLLDKAIDEKVDSIFSQQFMD